MGYETGFRGRGSRLDEVLSGSVRARFWEAVGSGLTPTAAATVAGVSGATGRQWAQDAGYRSSPRVRGRKYPTRVREAFWAALRSGATPLQAAVSAGVSEHTGRYWIQQAGFVPRTPVPVEPEADTAPPPAGAMSFVERCRLEGLLETGCRPARAAVLLGRHRDTIRREIVRGQTGSGYRARVGQDVIDANLKRPKERRLETRPALFRSSP